MMKTIPLLAGIVLAASAAIVINAKTSWADADANQEPRACSIIRAEIVAGQNQPATQRSMMLPYLYANMGCSFTALVKAMGYPVEDRR